MDRTQCTPLRFLVILLLTYASIKWAYAIGFADNYVVSIWPAAGIVYWSVRKFGFWAIIPLFLGNAIHSAETAIPLIFYVPSLTNGLAALAAVSIEKRFNAHRSVFSNANTVFAFLLAGIGLFTLFASIAGTLIVNIFSPLTLVKSVTTFWRWILSDYTGALLFSPFLLYLDTDSQSNNKRRFHIMEIFALFLTILSIWLFLISGLGSLYGHYATMLLMLPAGLWFAFTLDSLRVSFYFTIMSLMALILTLFFSGSISDISWLIVQLYLTLILVCGYIVHSIINERRYLLEQLHEEKILLESHVQQRTQELITARSNAERANEAKSLFLANMSHDLRTPINGIQGMLQILDSTSLNEEQKHYVSTSIQSCTLLARLLADILDLTKIESDTLSFCTRPVNLHSFLTSICELIKTQIKLKELNFYTDYDFLNGIIVEADETRLRQIIFNLLGNSVKYTTRGYIKVSAAIVSKDESTIVIKFSIEDTGIGINVESIEKIFEPFFRASNTFNLYDGIGLGLSIAKKLIDIMNGNITIISTEGKGSIVEFQIPFKYADEAPITELYSENIYSSSIKLKVLLAEDDPLNMFVSKTLLEKIGCTVTGTVNGLEVIEWLRKEKFDCLITDIQMPSMDGLTLTKTIRNEIGLKPDIFPIVALTAFAMKGDEENYLSSGMDFYITKPVEKDKLMRIMQVIQHRISKIQLQ